MLILGRLMTIPVFFINSVKDAAALLFACFGYLAHSFTGLPFPAYEDKVWNFTEPVLNAELAIMALLIIIGAKEKRLAAAS